MSNEKIDMGSLTQKELLILINDRVIRIDTRLTDYEKENLELKLKVNAMETKLKIWAAIIAIVSGGVISIIIHFLTR